MEDLTLLPLLNFRRSALKKYRRYLPTYFHQRLQRIKALHWEFGPIAADDIKLNLCEPDVTF